MTKVILVRHGQTLWNHEMKYQGHTDIALTEEGIRQAELVAVRLADEPITAVYASDLSRAFVTAEHIAAKHGLIVASVPALREICFGDWEGLTYDGIDERWPGLLEKLYSFADEVEIPGGESFPIVKERAYAAVCELVNKHPGETIAIVSHGGTIRSIICAVLNLHLNQVWSLKQDNTAVNILEYYEDRVMLELFNDSCHLRQESNKTG